MNQSQSSAIPAMPQYPTMISHSIVSRGEGTTKSWIVVCEYPDCVREFDGKNWRVTEYKRNQPPQYNAIFTKEDSHIAGHVS